MIWPMVASTLPSLWILSGNASPAQVTISAREVVLENASIRRVIHTQPFVGTTSFVRRETRQEFIRTVEPEARVFVNGIEYWLGGVATVPNKAFLTSDWIDAAKPSPKSLRLKSVTQVRPESMVPHQVDGKPWIPAGQACQLEFEHDDFIATVTLELPDAHPAIRKWVSVTPKPGKTITVDQIVTERLSLVEAESEVEHNTRWRLPNVTVLTDMSFGGNPGTSTFWDTDASYETQVNYQLQTPCVLEVRPPHGIHVRTSRQSVRSVTANTILHTGSERERNSWEQRQLFRTLAPWILDNPLMLHVVSNDDQEIRTAIDQASECGFEMVIMSFGSGLNMEDTSASNLARWRGHREYANAKGVRFGGYSLLASRRISDEHDVINPTTGKTGGAIFGNSPCLGSEWGLDYFQRIRTFFEETGFQILEHDGNYPGDRCASTKHPGHDGLEDSQWRQYQIITEFYRWCRQRNVFLNVPDYYHLNGSNKTAMGYRETNWSLPREQQHIHARQHLFDGTWTKTPSMGWMFVPLVQYHGGGPAATIEPLREHLADYEMHFANTFGFGAQACWRGTRLYDSPETKAVVIRMVQWFKEHRDVLQADVIHLRRADGRDLDYILHVLPGKEPTAMLVVFNPTGEERSESILVPLTEFGFAGHVAANVANQSRITHESGKPIKVTVKPRSWTWVRFDILGPARD